MVYRILSMDGGNGMNTATLLQGLETILGSDTGMKGYLDDVGLFAGTSDGGLNALYLAMNESPTASLANIQSFWSGVNKAMFINAISPASVVLGLAGVSALSSSAALEQYFISFFGSTTTLGDLKQKVLIVSFQLDNEDPLHQRWTPKFFKNFGPPGENDSDLLLVDVALRTTAFPILRPIFQAVSQTGSGYVDGAVVANQPSMCALAHTFKVLDSELGRRTTPDDVMLLSLGTGANPVGAPTYLSPKMDDGFANWGYFQWLTNPQSPLTLVNLILQSNDLTVDYQCGCILRERYHRVNPDAEHDLIPDDEATQIQLKAGATWIREIGWQEPTAPPPAPAPKPAPSPTPKPAPAASHPRSTKHK